MKYNTVRQRRKVYARLLKEAKKSEYAYGFCMCHEIAALVHKPRSSMSMEKQFPELWKSGPRVKNLFWYPTDIDGLRQRIACIKRAIKKCDTEIQKQNDEI